MHNLNLLKQYCTDHLDRELQESTTIMPATTMTPIPLGSSENPATSCKQISQDRPSGEYWIQPTNTSDPRQVFCDTSPRNCSCNSVGRWARVANIDMTDPNQNCPNGFRLVSRTEPPRRMCGRPGPIGCVSTTFSTHGIEYSRVCGRVIGYQDNTPDAFEAYATGAATSIDSYYVGGASLTHGQSPRQHIWTFACAIDEVESHNKDNSCPCIKPEEAFNSAIPSFVGQDYFCDTGARSSFQFIFYPDDPLWDGQGCEGTSTCCEFNNPPWFCKQLPQSTTDDIELRLCDNEITNNEDTPLERVEIYIN